MHLQLFAVHENPLSCSGEERDKRHFSGTQWNKSSKNRRCKMCVDIDSTVAEESSKPECTTADAGRGEELGDGHSAKPKSMGAIKKKSNKKSSKKKKNKSQVFEFSCWGLLSDMLVEA